MKRIARCLVALLLAWLAPLAVTARDALGAAPAPSAKPAAAARAPRMVLPFIEDDYDKALHEARARGIPIFIEAWAPW